MAKLSLPMVLLLMSLIPLASADLRGVTFPAPTVVSFNNATGQVNNSFYWNNLDTTNLSSYVPYLGASKNLLSGFNISAAFLSGNLSWLNLTSFPSACAAGSYVSAVNSILTCSQPPTYNVTYDGLNTSILTNGTATYVPYVGASGNVNLSNFNLSLRSLSINSSISGINNITAGAGDFAFGSVALGGNITASNFPGTFAFGYVQGINNTITAGGAANTWGDIALGVVRQAGGVGVNNTIRSTGRGSLAGGYISQADNALIESSGFGSIAWGVASGGYAFTKASGTSAVAIGSNVIASGSNSFALGSGDIASGTPSFVFGNAFTGVNSSMTASGISSFVVGTIQSNSGPDNLSISATQDAAVVFGYNVPPSLSTGNATISAAGLGTVVFGSNLNVNTSIIATGSGAFIHGYNNAQGSGANTNIIASGAGSFIHGITDTGLNLVASGLGSTVIGRANLTASGIVSIAMGTNVSVYGNNSMAIGIGTTAQQAVLRNNVFSIMTGAVGINTTAPSESFDIEQGNFYLNATTNPILKMGWNKELNEYFDNTAKTYVINPQTTGAANVSILSSLNVSNNLTIGSNAYILGYSNATHFQGEGSQITNITASPAAGSLTSLAQDFTDSANVGTDETKLYQLNLAANQLTNIGDTVHCSLSGNVGSFASSTERIRLYYMNGSVNTQLFDTGALTVAAGSDYILDTVITRVNATRMKAQTKLNSNAAVGSFTSQVVADFQKFSVINYLNLTGTSAGIGGGSNEIFYNMSLCDYRRGA